jgi:hypothetical protein
VDLQHLRLRIRPLLVLSLLWPAVALPPPAGAAAQSVIAPFNAVIVNPCNGESVTLSGRIHTVVQDTQDAAGGTHSVVHVNFQGIGGQGTSGARYRFTGLNTQVVTNETLGASVTTTVVSTRLVGQGPVPDQVMHLLVHTTINANGEVTASISEVQSECR